MSRSRIFHLYGDVTIAGEGLQNLGLSSALSAIEQGRIKGLQNLGLCSALRAFEQGGIFIEPHLL
jgi:hypothetical protein